VIDSFWQGKVRPPACLLLFWCSGNGILPARSETCDGSTNADIFDGFHEKRPASVVCSRTDLRLLPTIPGAVRAICCLRARINCRDLRGWYILSRLSSGCRWCCIPLLESVKPYGNAPIKVIPFVIGGDEEVRNLLELRCASRLDRVTMGDNSNRDENILDADRAAPYS